MFFIKPLIVLAVATTAFGSPAGYAAFLPPADTDTDGRIVGGVKVIENEIPWQVSLQSSTGYHTCGGSIISPDWIVTAGHCAEPTYNHWVRAGSLQYASGGSVHVMVEQVVHPDYNPENLLNDISLWKVDPPFVFDVTTGPVNLPLQGTPTPAGTLTWVSGWGSIYYGGPIPDDLLKVDVPIVDKDTCNEQFAYRGGILPNQICAGYPQGGKDSCYGDSGGPLYLTETSTLHGIVSDGYDCALPNFPGLYTEVSAYRDWITQVTGV